LRDSDVYLALVFDETGRRRLMTRAEFERDYLNVAGSFPHTNRTLITQIVSVSADLLQAWRYSGTEGRQRDGASFAHQLLRSFTQPAVIPEWSIALQLREPLQHLQRQLEQYLAMGVPVNLIEGIVNELNWFPINPIWRQIFNSPVFEQYMLSYGFERTDADYFQTHQEDHYIVVALAGWENPEEFVEGVFEGSRLPSRYIDLMQSRPERVRIYRLRRESALGQLTYEGLSSVEADGVRIVSRAWRGEQREPSEYARRRATMVEGGSIVLSATEALQALRDNQDTHAYALYETSTGGVVYEEVTMADLENESRWADRCVSFFAYLNGDPIEPPPPDAIDWALYRVFPSRLRREIIQNRTRHGAVFEILRREVADQMENLTVRDGEPAREEAVIEAANSVMREALRADFGSRLGEALFRLGITRANRERMSARLESRRELESRPAFREWLRSLPVRGR
jgi:hypothetical protein